MMWTPEAVSAAAAAITVICTAGVFLVRTSNKVIDSKIQARVEPVDARLTEHEYSNALQFDQFERSFRSVHARIGEVRNDTLYLRERIDRVLDTKP